MDEESVRVEHREGKWYVVQDDKVLAGPYSTNEAAYHWIDRNRTRPLWQRAINDF